MNTTRCFASLLFVVSLLLVSCGDKEERIEKRMGKGFRLPNGDAEDGQAAFVQLQCHRCHNVEGAKLPEAENRPDGISFTLGGEVRKVKTYGELVTAIIQPQHVISPDYLATLEKEERPKLSPMLNYNDTMTVLQLTDIVTFLHEHYEKAVPEYDDSPYYGP